MHPLQYGRTTSTRIEITYSSLRVDYFFERECVIEYNHFLGNPALRTAIGEDL